MDNATMPDEVAAEPFRDRPAITIPVARIPSSFPGFNRYIRALIRCKYLLE